MFTALGTTYDQLMTPEVESYFVLIHDPRLSDAELNTVEHNISALKTSLRGVEAAIHGEANLDEAVRMLDEVKYVAGL